MSLQGAAKTAAWLPDGMAFAVESGENPSDADAAETGADGTSGAGDHACGSLSADEPTVDVGAGETDATGTTTPAGPDAGNLPDFLREHVAIVHVGADGKTRSVDPVDALLSGKHRDAVPRTAGRNGMKAVAQTNEANTEEETAAIIAAQNDAFRRNIALPEGFPAVPGTAAHKASKATPYPKRRQSRPRLLTNPVNFWRGFVYGIGFRRLSAC